MEKIIIKGIFFAFKTKSHFIPIALICANVLIISFMYSCDKEEDTNSSEQFPPKELVGLVYKVTLSNGIYQYYEFNILDQGRRKEFFPGEFIGGFWYEYKIINSSKAELKIRDMTPTRSEFLFELTYKSNTNGDLKVTAFHGTYGESGDKGTFKKTNCTLLELCSE